MKGVLKTLSEEKLITVIVPVHNVANYLVQCVESICNQTYQNLQIILVEDGSTDGSDKMCDEFEDPRIEVIHSVTRGLSAARNVGIEIAKGDYITFVDSDDYLLPQMYEKLVQAMADSEIDFAGCGIVYSEDGVFQKNDEKKQSVCKLDYGGSVDALSYTYMFMVWNKLYRRELIDNIRFEDVAFEDVGFMRKLFDKVKYTAYVEEQLYVYRVMNVGSTSFNRNRYFHEKQLPVIDEYEHFIETLEEKKMPDQACKIRGQQLGIIKQIYNFTTDNDQESKKLLHSMFRERLFKNNGWKNYTLSFMLFFIFPEISRRKYVKLIESKLRKNS